MADQRFTPTFVPNRYPDRVQRAAVLRAFYPVARSSDEIRHQTLRLQQLWRTGLIRLHQQGWVPRRGARSTILNMQFARNCCPAFVYTTPRTRPCCLRAICPFCYARWVLSVWEVLQRSFPHLAEQPLPEGVRPIQLDVPSPLPIQPYWLVERQASFRLWFIPTATAQKAAQSDRRPGPAAAQRRRSKSALPLVVREPARMTAYLRGCLEQLLLERARWIRSCRQVRGAFATVTIEPWEHCWYITQRQIFQVEPGYSLPISPASPERQEKITIQEHSRVTPKVVFQAVSRACRYPALLLRGDAALVAILLEARRGQRLPATYGSLRRGYSES